jgi:hypothetical protein
MSIITGEPLEEVSGVVDLAHRHGGELERRRPSRRTRQDLVDRGVVERQAGGADEERRSLLWGHAQIAHPQLGELAGDAESTDTDARVGSADDHEVCGARSPHDERRDVGDQLRTVNRLEAVQNDHDVVDEGEVGHQPVDQLRPERASADVEQIEVGGEIVGERFDEPGGERPHEVHGVIVGVAQIDPGHWPISGLSPLGDRDRLPVPRRCHHDGGASACSAGDRVDESRAGEGPRRHQGETTTHNGARHSGDSTDLDELETEIADPFEDAVQFRLVGESASQVRPCRVGPDHRHRSERASGPGTDLAADHHDVLNGGRRDGSHLRRCR